MGCLASNDNDVAAANSGDQFSKNHAVIADQPTCDSEPSTPDKNNNNNSTSLARVPSNSAGDNDVIGASSLSSKLQQVARMVELNNVIPETHSVDGTQLSEDEKGTDIVTPAAADIHAAEAAAEEEDDGDDFVAELRDDHHTIHTDHAPDEKHDIYKSDEADGGDGEDQFNKCLTMYEITDTMMSNIDELIAAKVAELSQASSFSILESASSTLAGQKNGKRKTNQDSFFMHDAFGPSNILQLYGVCDGHGPSGHNVSQYCSTHLPQLLLKDKTRILTTLSKPGYALIRAFEELEHKLDAEKQSGALSFDMSASGTTVSCGLRVGNALYLANLGDSRAVMGTYDLYSRRNTVTFSKIKIRSRALTVDHDPKNALEAARIQQSTRGKLLLDDDGGSRIQINLIDDKRAKPRQSVLQLKQTYGVDALKQLNAVSASVSRSIGDKVAHKYGGVISKPDIIIHALDENDLFCMWASDGVWQVIDNGDVTRVIGNKLKVIGNTAASSDGELQKVTDKIVKESNLVWQDEFDDYVDDITAVVVRIGRKS
eukprot:CAMPEP_0202709478 /NCGR_PEP_ID=MMETSP1385-20130828/21598_1 /ASSEMBLY_ACC=CAM_ASM_000861 /TAXON_ID=933848 /ORGANISM="Elphidium margaritaceum" /LENGTH=542 /DNA_ID=CAMNT_0049368755 /DNA_START=49 /DNA_END=1677 /DNA_ORIENTATION=+